MSDSTIVKGVAYWASVHRANKYGKYAIELVVDDKTSAELKELGLLPSFNSRAHGGGSKSHADEGHPGDVFAFSSNAVAADGRDMGPLKVQDSQCNPLPASVLIGNGSVVNVITTVKEIKDNMGKTMTKAYLNGVQVVELVAYESKGPSFSPVKSGYVAPAVAETATTTSAVVHDTGRDSDEVF